MDALNRIRKLYELLKQEKDKQEALKLEEKFFQEIDKVVAAAHNRGFQEGYSEKYDE